MEFHSLAGQTALLPYQLREVRTEEDDEGVKFVHFRHGRRKIKTWKIDELDGLLAQLKAAIPKIEIRREW